MGNVGDDKYTRIGRLVYCGKKAMYSRIRVDIQVKFIVITKNINCTKSIHCT